MTFTVLQRPEIKPSTLDKGKGQAPVDASSRPESSWDITAQLVLPAPNKDIGLTAQHPELQAVLRDTMLIIKIFMLFTEAYPLMASRAGFGRPRMIEAAEARATAIHILERLLTDPSFGAILAPIVSCNFAYNDIADSRFPANRPHEHSSWQLQALRRQLCSCLLWVRRLDT